jgi:hypothetical protein
MVLQACAFASASVPASANGAAATASRATTVGSASRFFGMHVTKLATSFPAELDNTVGAVDLTTNQVYWPDLQPTGDAPPDFTRLDALVQRAEEHGAKPMVVLGLTPSWLAASPAAAPPMDAWQDYVSAVVAQYGTRIDYEIWPEPNIKSNWAGTPKQLARRVVAAAKIIHGATGGKAVVVSPAMVVRMKYQRDFMDKFFATKVGGKRVGNKIDAVGVDLYPSLTGTPEDSMTLLGKVRKLLRSHRVSAPVWNVEINYGVRGGGQTTSRHSSPTKQASYVVRTYVLNAAARVKRVYWLGWGSYPTMDVGLADSAGTPTKAGRVYPVVATWLAGQKSRTCETNKKKHLYSCKLVRNGRASWVYWTTKGRTVIRAPKGVRHKQTMTGEVSGTHAGKKLRVTHSPLFVYH